MYTVYTYIYFFLLYFFFFLDQVNTVQGSFKITSGATFTSELQDPSSSNFKSLAFDVQKMVCVLSVTVVLNYFYLAVLVI